MSLVSIIIPVYNGETYLGKAIESALSQTWPAKEIIVVNDGSPDNSLAVAKQYEDCGVVVVDQPNRGASAARNTGLAVAKGEWIQFLDADDFLREDKIELQMRQLRGDGEIAVCKTIHFLNDLSKQMPDNEYFFQAYLNDPLRFLIKLYGGFDYHSGMIQPNAFLVSRSVVNKAGKWNEELSLDDDGEFFCRIVLHAESIVYSSEPMNFYRKYKQDRSLSASKTSKAYQSQFKSIYLRHQHLLDACKNEELVPFIHTATYKALEGLLHSLYPNHKELYAEVQVFAKTLIKHHSRGETVYGGTLANFIGNKISWKLLKRLQNLRSGL